VSIFANQLTIHGSAGVAGKILLSRSDTINITPSLRFGRGGFKDAGSKEKSWFTKGIHRSIFMVFAAPHSFTKWQALRFRSVVDSKR
jgi:hypothetical protein